MGKHNPGEFCFHDAVEYGDDRLGFLCACQIDSSEMVTVV